MYFFVDSIFDLRFYIIHLFYYTPLSFDFPKL